MLVDSSFLTVISSQPHDFHLGSMKVLNCGHWITMIGQFTADWQLYSMLLYFHPTVRKEDCTLLKAWEFSPSHPLHGGGPEPQLLKCINNLKSGIGLIPRERKVISLKYLK